MNCSNTQRNYGMVVLLRPARTKRSEKETRLLHTYEKTVWRLKKTKSSGQELVCTWGCEFRKLQQQKSNPENEMKLHPAVKTLLTFGLVSKALEEGYKNVVQDETKRRHPFCRFNYPAPLHQQIFQISCRPSNSARRTNLSTDVH